MPEQDAATHITHNYRLGRKPESTRATLHGIDWRLKLLHSTFDCGVGAIGATVDLAVPASFFVLVGNLGCLTRGSLLARSEFGRLAGVGGLACEAFALFVSVGGRRWRKEPREPSAEIYARIFRGGPTLAA